MKIENNNVDVSDNVSIHITIREQKGSDRWNFICKYLEGF